MGKIIDFFRGRKESASTPSRDVRRLVAPMARPAIQLVLSSEESRSHFGGVPPAGTEAQWPSRKGKPLMFLASIHLPSLERIRDFEWMPSEGYLCFFYDVEHQPWGFDPKDKDGWAVLHMPEGTGISAPPKSNAALPHRYVEFRRIDTFPSCERPDARLLNLSDEELDEFGDFAMDAYGGSESHQIGGYPWPIQGDDMELQCQLVSHGIYCGDATGYRSAEAQELKAGAEDWRLLFQMASDDELEVMWGDLGNLYFWIREQDSRANAFDRVWTVLQCS